MANYKDVEEEEVEIEKLNDSDFADKHGKAATCVVQKLLCNQKAPDTTQRHQIFYSTCLVKSKVCNLIIDNRSCENIISRTNTHGLFEARDGTTISTLHHWLDQERLLHQDNRFMPCFYFNWQTLSRFCFLCCGRYGYMSYSFGETMPT